MTDRGIPPNLLCYTAALSACSRSGQWAAALRLWNQMDERNVSADSVCIVEVLEACASAGEWQAGLQVVEALPPCLHTVGEKQSNG